jgi:myotubularin-related protein 6/7/8
VCWRQGKKIVGSLHMMPHHLLFRYQWPQPSEQSQTSDPLPTDPPQSTPVKETWIGYPLIGSCNYRPSPPASHLPPQIRLRCRDFTFFAFHFDDDLQAREIFDTIRNSTCKIGHVDQLLAFSYNSNTEKACNGWDLYDPRKEFARMGISEKSVDKGWRISKINSKYEVSET